MTDGIKIRGCVVGLFVVVAAAGIAVIALFDPEKSPFFPKCFFYLLTGWQCPACGSQRALHSLLIGDAARAFAYNPFLIISLPYLVAVAYTSFCRSPFAVRAKRVVQDARVVKVYFVALLLWWIVRNL